MLSKIIDGIDSIPHKALLGINLAIGFFVLMAHGGSLALSLSKDQEVSSLVLFTVPISLFIIATCTVGFFSDKQRLRILSIHSLILVCGSILVFYYGLSLLLKGFPEGNFSWGVGFFTFFCVYPVYLIRRTILGGIISKSNIIKYLHVPIFIIAFCLDITVLITAMEHFSHYQQELFQKFKVK
jgi:hypothetical protein